MPGRYIIPDWKPVDIIPVLIPATASITYGIYTLAFPPSTSLGRKLSTLFLSILIFFAFRHSEHLAPSFDICDSFARASLIWLAHMSYEICILEFAPDVQPGSGETKERIRQACKVFFDRSRTQVLEEERKRAMKTANETKALVQQHGDTDKKTDEPIKAPGTIKQKRTTFANYQHGYTRSQLIRYHVVKAITLYILYTSWEKYLLFISPLGNNPWLRFDTDQIALFSYVLHWKDLLWRIEETINWTIITMWFYESFHSVCAVIHLGIGIDGPDEWSLNLFGTLKDAWSVRRYWSKYWHNFIYHSFIAHVKCVTRDWIGMKRGSLVTRLIENTLVFFISGVMHSMVRWQEEPESDVWSVTGLYTAQMIPIVIEGLVAFYWKKVRRALGYGPQVEWMNRAEYAIGYVWCFAWMFYCVPTYWLIRDRWTEEKMEKAYLAKHGPGALNQTALED